MADSFIIKDVRIFTGTSEISKGYVQVTSGLISAYGDGEPIQVPEGVKVFSKLNHTLLPGFIDAHIHADKGNVLALQQALRFGVTTVMDMHNEFPNVDKLKKFATERKNEAADFKSSGISGTIDGGWPVPVVTAHDKSPEVGGRWQFFMDRPMCKMPQTDDLEDSRRNRDMAQTVIAIRSRRIRQVQPIPRLRLHQANARIRRLHGRIVPQAFRRAPTSHHHRRPRRRPRRSRARPRPDRHA